VLGWKVARVRPDLVPKWGAERIAGPIFDARDATAGAPSVALIEGGFAAAEAEFILPIGRVPNGPVVTFDEAADAVGAVRVGIEVAGSPYAAINAHGPAVTVSDFGNNLGLVLGDDVSQANAGEVAGWAVASFLNGELVGSGDAGGLAGGPIDAARFLFELAARYGLAVETGQWISTGAITGGHPVAPGDEFEARFGNRERVSCHFGLQRP